MNTVQELKTLLEKYGDIKSSGMAGKGSLAHIGSGHRYVMYGTGGLTVLGRRYKNPRLALVSLRVALKDKVRAMVEDVESFK